MHEGGMQLCSFAFSVHRLVYFLRDGHDCGWRLELAL